MGHDPCHDMDHLKTGPHIGTPKWVMDYDPQGVPYGVLGHSPVITISACAHMVYEESSSIPCTSSYSYLVHVHSAQHSVYPYLGPLDPSEGVQKGP